jgi:hypothetical protein
MNTTTQQLNKHTLNLIASAHPVPMAFDSLFAELRAIDGTLTRFEMQNALGALLANRLVKKLPATVTDPARFALTPDGAAHLEASA